MLDQPHQPAAQNRSANEQDKAESAKPDHHLWFGSLRDSEDNRCKQGEEQYGSEVRDGHEAFLPVASECASTAAMMFSKPATTMNFVP